MLFAYPGKAIRVALTAVLLIALIASFMLVGCYLEKTAASVSASSSDSVASASSSDASPASSSLSSASAIELVTLVRVVDGDTLVLHRADGSVERCRLIGIDAPESVHPEEERNTAEGVTASDYMKSLVYEGQMLYLESDVSDRDKYNRLLRYVWIREPGACDAEDVSTGMLNGIMVASGHAMPKRYPPDTAYADVFEQILHGY